MTAVGPEKTGQGEVGKWTSTGSERNSLGAIQKKKHRHFWRTVFTSRLRFGDGVLDDSVVEVAAGSCIHQPLSVSVDDDDG